MERTNVREERGEIPPPALDPKELNFSMVWRRRSGKNVNLLLQGRSGRMGHPGASGGQ